MTEKVQFKAVVQKGHKIQIPKHIRWYFKLEATQILKIHMADMSVFCGGQTFYSTMTKDGRLRIPLLQRRLLGGGRAYLAGHVMDVTLFPA